MSFCSIRIVTDIRTQDLRNSLPISFESKYCLPISTTVNFCIFAPLLILADCSFYSTLLPFSGHELYTGLFISPSGISELDCATTKTDTAERSIYIGRESLQVFFVLGALAYFQVPPLGGSREEKWRSQ